MKTTLDIADPLFKEAKALAHKEKITMRALVEQGLRMVLAERRDSRSPFRLRDASVPGNGLQPEATTLSWEQIRALTYEGRGG